ncbi:SMC family ATPase, partial [Candidatus Daviesbacteria bacterium]|nr:SMC family ATPase [Candidatus Daviesbacteria bacterium]
MIPLSLKLTNFTSYGEGTPVLDFNQFKMAVISGSNGAGKSSLLDAITWCIWGSSRAGDSADSLIRLGQNQMAVEFSFKLDGHEYIIKRARSKKSGGQTALELWSGSALSSQVNLTEGTIKATQQKIIDLLHLNYDTFTNSSFLRQNHADEFTTKGPTDRKKILADILGLDHYDKLEEKAKEKAKEIHNQIELLTYKLTETEAELLHKDENLSQKNEAEKRLSVLESALTSVEKELKVLQEQKTTLASADSQRQQLDKTYQDLKRELDEITTLGKTLAESIKIKTSQLEELPQVMAKLSEFKDLQSQVDELNVKKAQKLELE